MNSSRISRIAITFFAMVFATALLAGSAHARIARVVDVKANSTVKYTPTSAGGGHYSGKISFPKVRPVFDGEKVPKKMAEKARQACYRMYAGGPRGEFTPLVLLLQRPKTYGGLRKNDYSEAKFSRNGTWWTWGGSPTSGSELYSGNKIEAQGGLWDEYYANRKSSQSVNFKYKRMTREAQCRPFTAVYDPK